MCILPETGIERETGTSFDCTAVENGNVYTTAIAGLVLKGTSDMFLSEQLKPGLLKAVTGQHKIFHHCFDLSDVVASGGRRSFLAVAQL